MMDDGDCNGRQRGIGADRGHDRHLAAGNRRMPAGAGAGAAAAPAAAAWKLLK